MFVSILQRSVPMKAGDPGEPLQSRADFNPRTSRPGRSGEEVRVSTGLKTAGMAADKPDNQVKDRLGGVNTRPARNRHEDHPKLLPRGDMK